MTPRQDTDGRGRPIRYPDVASPRVMTTRAWYLVILNFLVPGAPQVLAGSRRFGRFGLFFTLLLWGLAAVTAVIYLIWPQVIFSIVTLEWTLTAVQGFLTFFAALWLILTLDTLRLVRMVRIRPPMRAIVSFFTVALLLGTAGSAAYGAYLVNVQRGLVSSIFNVQAAAEPPVNGRYNILLLGGDAGPDRDGLRPDSLSVVSIEADTGKVTMVGVPRDLENTPLATTSPLSGSDYAPDGSYDCGSDCQISFLYSRVMTFSQDLYPDAAAKGSNAGVEATKDAVEGALGISLQYYVLIDMQGFADLIDALGGVDINVAERLPIGGDEQLNEVEGWIEAGQQHMDGATALWYARSRHTTSDYDRMQRQRVLQAAILTQFSPVNVLSKFQGIAEAGAQVVKTDIPQSTLAYFIDLAMKSKGQKIDTIELVPPDVDPQAPDFTAIHQKIADALVLSTAK